MCLSEEHAARLQALGPSSKRAKKEAPATEQDKSQFWAAGDVRLRVDHCFTGHTLLLATDATRSMPTVDCINS